MCSPIIGSCVSSSVTPGTQVYSSPINTSIWQTRVSSDPAVIAIVVDASQNVFVQTSDKLLALSSLDGSIQWSVVVPLATKIQLLSNKNIVCVTDFGKKLTLICSKTGSVMKTLTSTSWQNKAPVVSAKGEIFLPYKDRGCLAVYDASLQFIKDIDLATGPIDKMCMLERTLVCVSGQTLIYFDTQSLQAQQIAFAHNLSIMAKASSQTLFISLEDGQQFLFDEPQESMTQIKLPIAPQTYPRVIDDMQNGRCMLFQSQPHHKGFGEYSYGIVCAQVSGERRWSVSETVEPRFMVVDHNNNSIVSFSTSHATATFGAPFQQAPLCSIKTFDSRGNELAKYLSSTPILSSFAVDSQGKVYFYSDGHVHAL